VTVALTLGAAACGGGKPAQKALGGVTYRWPPPAAATVGPPSPARFCQLLVDDYQNLKTSQQVHGPGPVRRVFQDYIAFAPTLEGAAPVAIAPAVRLYVNTIAGFLGDLAAHNFNVFELSHDELASISTSSVSAAAGTLIGYSSDECHYDLQANSARAPQRI
jgi:hypothetical protein